MLADGTTAMITDADRHFVHDYLRQSQAALDAFVADAGTLGLLAGMADMVVAAMRSGGKLMLMGNGGSAGDAQHIAGEFTGRLMYDRDPLPAVALTTDTSAMTAIGTDYGFDLVFERQVLGLGRPGDVVWGISTSGSSNNVVRALEAARTRGMGTLGFAGAGGGAMAACTDLLLRAPSAWTPVIQQVHITAAHLVCGLVERAMFPRNG